jgi:7-cyano-7-deazaguanine reductase
LREIAVSVILFGIPVETGVHKDFQYTGACHGYRSGIRRYDERNPDSCFCGVVPIKVEKPMTDHSRAEFTQLGRTVDIPTRPEDALLETFQNMNRGIDYVIRLTAPELTTICPITRQPDFAALVIDYVPDEKLVESKSFKLFLESFRSSGIFNEDCTVYIHKRLSHVLAPKYIRVAGLWNARGGVAIDVVIESGTLPPNCAPLPLDRIAYRGGRV